MTEARDGAGLDAAVLGVSAPPAQPVEPVTLVPHDDLADARTRWEQGDWAGLASISEAAVRQHPQRAKLALLAAAGHAQRGEAPAAREWASKAVAWGCPRALVAKVLVSGVFNSLGRALALAGKQQDSLRHFDEAMQLVSDRSVEDRSHGRAVRELISLGLLQEATTLLGRQSEALVRPDLLPAQAAARVTMLRSEVEMIHHELSLLHQRALAPKSVPDAELALRSTSQLGQDLWVLQRTGFKRGGYFVEFGATDGVVLSNTYLLEKGYGWQGLCAEPNPKFFEQLRRNRSCTVSPACVAGRSGERVQFILADVYGGIDTYAGVDTHAGKREAYREAGEVVTVDTLSLDDLLESVNAPRSIDYISIDTEGSELEILRTFPLQKWRVRLFTIEHNFTAAREAIHQLLAQHGYRRTERDFDDWYELDD